MYRSCLAKIKVLPAAMRAYASSWNGWTNPDPDYYIKLGGYLLSYEEGYGPEPLRRVKDFVCPEDASPPKVHGLASSYFLIHSFVGTNIMELSGDASRIAVAKEIVFRHPPPNNPDGRKGAHVAFADGTAVLMGTKGWQELKRDESDK